jgi:hypothetical protein
MIAGMIEQRLGESRINCIEICDRTVSREPENDPVPFIHSLSCNLGPVGKRFEETGARKAQSRWRMETDRDCQSLSLVSGKTHGNVGKDCTKEHSDIYCKEIYAAVTSEGDSEAH